MNRKEFVKVSLALPLYGVIIPSYGKVVTIEQKEPIPIDIIKEFVAAGHNDLGKVKSMLEENPNLIHCRYDWGNGDFEEAIEGAGHLGNVEIAEYLISKGARVNLFVLTMLGKTELVKPVLEAYPALIFAKGPHGFSLLHHANKGGNRSIELAEYVQSKGLTETKFKL